MATAPPNQKAHNPLRHLPSIFVLPALQQRLARAKVGPPRSEEELVALLELDPLSVARGLRAVSPSVFRQSKAIPSVRELVGSLGTMLAQRLFRAKGEGVEDDPALLELWKHAIATAFAAKELAARTGLLAPDVAYMLGLLHDLPAWLERLDKDAAERGTLTLPTDWILHWQLPAPFVSMILAIEMSDRATSTEDPRSAAALIRAAELVAELAGFQHPGEECQILAAIGKALDQSDHRFAGQLEQQVQQALARFGLADEQADTPSDDALPPHTLLGVRRADDERMDEVVLSILGCTRSESYRGIITALTAAAVRYGAYDRAFYAKWNDASGEVLLRSKADSSARRMSETRHATSREEVEQLRNAIDNQQPIRMRSEINGSAGLLRSLSTDELVAIPLNHEFQTPAFLLLDRSVSLTPIDQEEDMTLARMLGMTGTLLVQNLLLRRRRQRAQKFALTDPLTRLFNRRMGLHALEQAISRTERDQAPLTVLMCDLDHFKRLNDKLGHVTGDAALRETADVLRHAVRKADTVCRYGGEEFLVVLPDTNPAEATLLATRMFTAVHERGEELGLPITISIGVTSHRFGDTMESILNRADRALYASKGYGRNRFSADIDPEPVDAEPETPRTTPDVS